MAAPTPVVRDSHENLNGTLWYQTSAEFRVDSASKYRIARQTLDTALANKGWTAALEQTGNVKSLPVAVIMDLDETVLDNSPAQGQQVIDRKPYVPATWSEWIALADAAAVPGAIDFIKYAQLKGVTVFFVTNRTKDEEPKTRENLQKFGISLPNDLDTVLTKGEQPDWSSDKGTRRKFVANKYRIALLIGDDLGDFLSGAKDTPQKRVTMAEQHPNWWGERWILLINPLYGSWEGALYGHDFSMPDDQVLKLKFDQVKGFK
jgi:acid phosphatase